MELNGVPLHPLVVHAVVVLGPLAALTGLVYAAVAPAVMLFLAGDSGARAAWG